MTPATAGHLVTDILLAMLVALPAIAAFCLATLILVLPGAALRTALGRSDEAFASRASGLRASLARSRALAFARRVMAHKWTAGEVVVCLVFLLTLAAGVLAILVAGYVLGVTRPTVADAALPWILGASIAVGMAYSWERRRSDPWLAAVVLVSGTLAVVAIALMKVEATNADPADYLTQHPVRDRLLAATWVAIEIGAFAACAAAGAGLMATVHALGSIVGLAMEALAAVVSGLLWLADFAVHVVFGAIRLTVGMALIPAELLYLGLRRRFGTDIDGNHHLPLPVGGLLTEHAALSAPMPKAERRNRN